MSEGNENRPGKPVLLEGVKVVDLSTVVFGPYCTQILADLGADVIKVEPPGGDQFRYSGRPAKSRGMSPGHMTLNRGKRSVVLDLKKPEDVKSIQALLANSDMFVHNVRRQAIERLGLGYEAVKVINPKIVYVHCVGFGSDGPYGDLQAYDDVIQAASGTATLLRRVDGDPRARYLPSLIADKVAGLHAAYACMAAMIHKLRTGEGQFVEVPMFEAFTHFMLKEHLAGQTFDPPVGTICYKRQIDPNRQPFPTADGFVSIVPYTDESWSTLFTVLGDPQFLKQEDYATPAGRGKNLAGLYKRVAEITPQRSSQAWVDALHAAAIPAMVVRDIADIRSDPHLQAVDFFSQQTHPTEGSIFSMKQPIRFGVANGRMPSPAPGIGEHTDSVKQDGWGDRAGPAADEPAS